MSEYEEQKRQADYDGWMNRPMSQQTADNPMLKYEYERARQRRQMMESDRYDVEDFQ
jgi:hypothetical protein